MTAIRAIKLGLAVCLLLSATANAQGSNSENASNELAALLELKGDPSRGKTIFTVCQDCHRKDASGRASGVYPRLAGQHASVLLKQISDIRSGRRNNPSMQPVVTTLSRNDIADVVSYIQSLPIGGSNGKGAGSGMSRGRQLYEQDCASCHGANGEGEPAKFYPMVAAQHYRYLLREVFSIRDGDRGNSDPAMVKVVKNYSPIDLEAVTDYMSQLPPPKQK
jgi:cytochrome c553